MIAENLVPALFAAGLLVGLWLLNKCSDAHVAADTSSPPDRRWPRPRRVGAKRPGGLTAGLVLAGMLVYAAALGVLLDRSLVPALALSLLPLAYAGSRRSRELWLLENGDVVEADLHGVNILTRRGAYLGRSLKVSFAHAGKKVSCELYVARHDPREGKRVTLLVDPEDSENVLVYEDSSFRILPP